MEACFLAGDDSSGQTDPCDVDRTMELREEDQGVSVHRRRDEQGRLEQAQMSRAAWMKMDFFRRHSKYHGFEPS